MAASKSCLSLLAGAPWPLHLGPVASPCKAWLQGGVQAGHSLLQSNAACGSSLPSFHKAHIYDLWQILAPAGLQGSNNYPALACTAPVIMTVSCTLLTLAATQRMDTPMLMASRPTKENL